MKIAIFRVVLVVLFVHTRIFNLVVLEIIVPFVFGYAVLLRSLVRSTVRFFFLGGHIGVVFESFEGHQPQNWTNHCEA